MNKIELKLSVTNCFLIQAGQHYVLVDTGYDYEWDRFCERLKAASVSLSAISHLILTHHHDDHAGLVDRIVENKPDVQVVMSSHAKPLRKQGRNVHTKGGGYINRRIALLFPALMAVRGIINKEQKWTQTFPPYQMRPNDVLVTGETQLSQFGIDLPGRIIETPGHSIDSISVLLEDGDCFVGDAAANVFQFAGTRYCVVAVDDLDAYYTSWDKIMTGRARRIFPAHGKPFPVEKLKENVGKNKKDNMVVIF